MIPRLRILVLLGLRSLAAHRVKSAIVGLILGFGTFLVVSGSALLDSVESAMEKSITSSLAGDLQVYSADAEDELALFGGFGMGTSDVGELPDIAKVEAAIEGIDGVEAVVPMGITQVTVFAGNEIDQVLDELRAAVDSNDQAAVDVGVSRVKSIVEAVAADHDSRVKILADKSKIAEERANIARARSPEFWASFETDPLNTLDFLDAGIAPLTADGRVLYLRTIGTDPDRFTKSFDRFYTVDGQGIPEGKRGFLFSKRTYEKVVKNKVARELDDLHDKWLAGARFADDPLLRERAERLGRQYSRVLFQVDPGEAAALEPKLRAELPGVEGDLAALVQAFLVVDDASVERRHAFFYAEIAPLVRLYEIPVGGTITLRAYTKSGYVKSVNVPVWGTYEFKGLEKSDLASASNLMDLVTWRELYGKMSAEQQAELSSIRAGVGVKDIDAASLEDELFGGGGDAAPAADVVADAPPTGFDEFAGVELGGRADKAGEATLDPKQLHQGLALNAAVILKDKTKRAEIAEKIRAVSDAQGLGLQVVGWQESTGMIGQFIVVMRVVLYVAIFVIFLVALVIINNSMVMATMERVGEIGTMRAIGAFRSFVVVMFLVETLALGLTAGTLGALLASAFVGWLGHTGIPAPADVFVILFAGQKLYPTQALSNHVFGIASILVVSVLSTLYPAVLAARVPPVVAMQGKE